MNRLSGITSRLPAMSAVANVAKQAVRQIVPKNEHHEQMPEGGPNERVNFAQATMNQTSGGSMEHCEMSNMSMNNQWSPTSDKGGLQGGEGYTQDGFNQNQTGYQTTSFGIKRQGTASSGFSDDDFQEGKLDYKIDEYQAAWNVTNAIQGMFIVSLPFAVLRGGYWAILAMVGIAYICCYTGRILVECLYEFNPQTGQQERVRESYVGIAKECFGKKVGGRIVNIAQIIELLMTCILYVVVCGDLMIGTFPMGAIDTRSWMMVIGIILLPLAFLKSLKAVSMLSFWCTMSHLLINAIIVGYCILQIGDWGWAKVKWTFDIENFPICLGIIVFSYTSQIFLPTLEGNMIDNSKFQWMLNWSHIWAAIFKALFGYICFLTFQNDTQQVITNNLHSAGFKGFVNICLVIKALLSYPLPYYAACELLERVFFRGRPKTVFPTIWNLDGELKVWGLAWRLGVIVFTILMACFIPHFSILMGFIGSFTGTMLSFIWPCYFHLKLKRNSMEMKDVYFDYFIIGLGFLFGIVGMYDSGSALIKAFAIGLPF